MKKIVNMNIIDTIIIICLIISTLWGFKDGAIRQAGALAAIIIAIILANAFGSTVAALLKIGGDYSHIWGYIIVLLLSMVAVGSVAHMLRTIVSVVGLGLLDRLLGALLGLVKSALILSLIFSLYNFANSSLSLFESSAVESSKLYAPITSTSSYIMPTIDWIEEQLPKVSGDGE